MGRWREDTGLATHPRPHSPQRAVPQSRALRLAVRARCPRGRDGRAGALQGLRRGRQRDACGWRGSVPTRVGMATGCPHGSPPSATGRAGQASSPAPAAGGEGQAAPVSSLPPCPAEPWLQSFGRSAGDNGDRQLGSGVAGRECSLGSGWPVSLEASRPLGLWRSGWSLDPGAGSHVPCGLPVCPLHQPGPLEYRSHKSTPQPPVLAHVVAGLGQGDRVSPLHAAPVLTLLPGRLVWGRRSPRAPERGQDSPHRVFWVLPGEGGYPAAGDVGQHGRGGVSPNEGPGQTAQVHACAHSQRPSLRFPIRTVQAR